jgi:peptidoglycan/xylan/chitin deacetylase (PgdA/CDA1 family)
MNYDKGIDRENFERQINSAGEYFEIVGVNEFIDILTGKVKPKRNTALLTFDDADSDFIKYAYPVLADRNYGATIFVPTAFPDSGKRFWHLRISNIIHNLDEKLLNQIQENISAFPKATQEIILSGSSNTEDEKANLCKRLINNLDKLNETEIDNIVSKLESISNVDYNLGIKCMSWQELRFLGEKGIDIESHTVNHKKLVLLDDEQIKNELQESKWTIENKLNKKVKSICYPAGSHNDNVVKIAELIYKIGFTTTKGICRYPSEGEDLFQLPRLTIYGNDKYELGFYFGKIALKRSYSTPLNDLK